MQLFNEIINNPHSNFDPLNFLGILATAIITMYIFKSEHSTSFTRERHDKLIFPIFDILEPVLYQDIDTTVLTKVLDIIQANKNLADGKLIELHYFCQNYPNQENFIALCSYIDSAYDKSCRRLHLKTRSMEYRFLRNQYHNKFFFALFFIKSAIVLFSVFTLFMLTLSAIIAILESTYNSISTSTQIILLLFLAVSLYAGMKYLFDHD